jgi:hypothetical protein
VPDNCPDDENSDQADSNDDGIGDACEDATDDCGIDADGDDIGDVSESGEFLRSYIIKIFLNFLNNIYRSHSLNARFTSLSYSRNGSSETAEEGTKRK